MRLLLALLSMLLTGQSAAREVMVLDLTGPRPTSSELVKMRSFSYTAGVSHGGTVGPPKWPVWARRSESDPLAARKVIHLEA